MEININWDNPTIDQILNKEIDSYLKSVKKQEFFDHIDVDIFERTNARHIIEVTIYTKNPNEKISTSGISCDYGTSFFDLKNKLNYLINKYDPNQYQRQIDLDLKKEKEKALAIKKQEEKNQKIKDAKLKAIEQKKLQEEKAKLKKIELHNKKLEQAKKKKEKQEAELNKQIEKEIQAELDKLNERETINQEKINKAIEHINNSSENISSDLQESNKIQSELKESKEKLRELWSEENECLVIIDKLKEWSKKVFDDKYYQPNQPFELVENKPIYHDGHGNFFAINESNEWVPYEKAAVEADFETFKANKMQKLEEDLIDARARTPKHILDLDDNKEIIKELNSSRTKLKEMNKQQKKDLKELKKQGDQFKKSTDEEIENQIYETGIDNIIFIETHPANEQFLSDYNQYAYHDGEGNYYVYDNEQWIPTTKENIYATSEKIKPKQTQQDQPEEHPVNEPFLNNSGIYFYYDENHNYYKYDNEQWVASSYEECYSDNNSASSQQAQTTDASGGQQWQDENGYWWYLDAQGNYYYADENGNWVPYQA